MKLAGRLGKLVQGRMVKSVTGPVTIGQLPMDGSIARLTKDALPISDILDKDRKVGRAPRSNDFMHVSDLLSKCTRMTALREMLGVAAKPQSLSFFDELTFAQGDAIHDTIKLRATAGAPNMIWGLWKCRCGLTSTTTPSLLSELVHALPCTYCQSPMDRYKELSVRDNEYMIVGNPDLLTYIPSLNALHVSELKSISHKIWEGLLNPIPDHVLQTVFYWSLLHRKKYRLTDKVSILYASKGWLFGGKPYKEFTVNVKENLHRLQPMVDEAVAIKQAREGGELPKRICTSPDVTQAKACDVCSACFGATNEAPIKLSFSAAVSRKARAS